MSDLFSEIILDEAKNPANFGELKNPDFVQTNYNASCGDVIKVFIKLDPSKTKIQAIKWTGSGCSISMAAMSLLSEKLKNKKISEIKKLNLNNMLKLLEIDSISPGRIKCLMIGINAIKTVI